MIKKMKFKYFKQTDKIFKENWEKNGGELKVPALRPTLFNMFNTYVLVVNSEVIGYITLNWKKNYINQAAISKQKQGRGYSAPFMKAVCEMQNKDIWLNVLLDNKASHGMVTGAGFECLGVDPKRPDTNLYVRHVR